MALVIVLGALVLLALIGIGFLASTTRELNASKSYASGLSARFYADAAVNIVLGQMRAATTEDNPGLVWTSQPGLLRQFDTQGNQTRVFKLYSSDHMIEGGGFSLLDSAGAPADVPAWTASTLTADLPWNRDPGVYTDLNAPVTVPTGTSSPRTNYPILNPGGLQNATRIEGFDVTAGYGLPDPADAAKVAQIPMPVRWLYILKDGSLATATNAGDKTIRLAQANGGAVPDTNPPVARVAFWTDDETCRLNVNTASEGDYWTLPLAVAADDELSRGQVSAREFQRYPGHPATTSLSPALGFLTTGTSALDLRNFIFGMAPRVSGGGSQFGAYRVDSRKAVTLDNDRLYASVDDLLFLPAFDASANERYRMTSANIKSLKAAELDNVVSGEWNTNTPYNFTAPISLGPEQLELVRFFLTVDSNAPEVNLFGKPRVSLWPVDTRAAYQSLQDKLLAFCATVNGHKYFFQRQNPDSRTEDYTGIARNQTLLTFLDRLTSDPVPGLAGNLATKYAASDRAQLLTEIFDWIRTVNLAYRDPVGSVQPYAWQVNPTPNGTTSPPGLPGSGQVLPIQIGATSGFGRFPTLSKGAFAIVREEEVPDQPSAGQTTVKYRVVFLMETYVPMLGYAGYVPNYQIRVSNLGGHFEAVTDRVASAGSTTPVSGSEQAFPLTFQDGTIQVTAPANVEPFQGRSWGGTQGYNSLFLCSNPALQARTLNSPDAATGYPFVSNQITVVADTAAKDLIRVGLRPLPPATEHNVHVELRNVSGSETLGSFDLPFAPFGPVAGAFLDTKPSGPSQDGLRPNLQERVDQMAEAYQEISGASNKAWAAKKNIFGAIDIVRGVELDHGDLRLSALHGSSASNPFVRHKDYTSPSRSHAHSLLSAGGGASAYDNSGLMQPGQVNPPKNQRGFLVADTAWGSTGGFFWGTAQAYLPQAPSAMVSVPGPGDFSTGLGSEGDGPHVLKADEGNTSFGGLNHGMSSQSPYQNQLFPWDARLSEIFSPNRQVTSAVQLGTLPSRAASDTPWRTLLFRPDIGPTTHPGANSPADSALLDLFWMPVVDPYPISRPLSTAGKVNMNCQIAPFTYVERTTALLGALKSVKLMAIPARHSEFYKWSGYTVDLSKNRPPISYLYEVDRPQTLRFFTERFTSTNPNATVFKSPTEICAIPLAPKHNTKSVIGTGHSENSPAYAIDSVNIAGATTAESLRTAIKSFWAKNTLTGDNAWEAPYNHLYPRLTTQSNTYTIYVQAQSLQVLPNASLANLPESKIRVNGEYRGSFGVERYIDQTDTSIPDFASAGNFSKTLYPFYKFRIKGARQFLPQ